MMIYEAVEYTCQRLVENWTELGSVQIYCNHDKNLGGLHATHLCQQIRGMSQNNLVPTY